MTRLTNLKDFQENLARKLREAGNAAEPPAGRLAVEAGGEGWLFRLEDTAERMLATFAERGFVAVADFLEANVPEAEREKAAEIYIRLLQGIAWEAWMLARERDRLPRLETSPARARFVQDSLTSISDTFFYGVPLYLQLAGYDEVKASVFQMTRSPGKTIVYWGCALLVIGIFAMLYLRERRVWVYVKQDGTAKLALSSNRRGVDIDREFERHREALSRLLPSGAANTENATS